MLRKNNMKEANMVRRLKILCLHGYRQNGTLFKQKTGAFRKAMKGFAEFTFVSAPNEVPGSITNETDSEVDKADPRAWWFTSSNNTFSSREVSENALGFQKSLDVIRDTINTEGPFDGVLGFSQGAALVSVLLGMQANELADFQFQFGIMFAGFKSLALPHIGSYEKKISIPTLHVFGESDEVISKEMSEKLTTFFDDPTIVVHSGGHYIPIKEKEKKEYLCFMQNIRDALQELNSLSEAYNDTS